MCWYVVVVYFLRRRVKVKCNMLTCGCIRHEARTRNDNYTQRRSRIAAHWTEDSFFQHLDGRSQPHKPHVVIWMTRFLRVNGHRSSELSLFLNIVVNGHVLTALLLSLLWSYSEFLFLRLGRSIFVFTGCAINQPRIDVEEVNPNFVMAPLICTPYAKRIVRDFEGTMHVNVPLSLGPRWLDKSAYVSQFAWYTIWSLQRCGAKRSK